jgi:hypothetical protein
LQSWGNWQVGALEWEQSLPDFLPAMTDKPEPKTATREYEQSGLYPANGKPFRLWALLGGLTLVILALAGVAMLLNFWLLPQA